MQAGFERIFPSLKKRHLDVSHRGRLGGKAADEGEGPEIKQNYSKSPDKSH
jgi:hypothetical protein